MTGSMAFCISGGKQYWQQRAAFWAGLCICRQHCAVNEINVGKIIRCLLLPQFAVRHFTARIPNGHMIGVILAFVYGYGGMFAAGNMTLANIYPITASMGLIQYRSYDAAVYWNIGLCSISMITVLLISAAIVATTKNASSAKIVKKVKKTVPKKGW